MVWESLGKYRDLGLLLLRLGVGLGFTYFHGWSKLVGGPERWNAVGGAARHLGIDVGHTALGFGAAFAESVGGVLIAAGLLFRPAALLLALTMVVATNSHLATGQGSPAHAFKNAWLFLGLLFVGPGRYSVDHWLLTRRSRPAGAPARMVD
ncbi:MAG: DoxX family protein [Gemmatimonadota bacterium]|nr:DoxX family protein [Gemmatimonadota bacterium]